MTGPIWLSYRLTVHSALFRLELGSCPGRRSFCNPHRYNVIYEMGDAVQCLGPWLKEFGPRRCPLAEDGIWQHANDKRTRWTTDDPRFLPWLAIPQHGDRILQPWGRAARDPQAESRSAAAAVQPSRALVVKTLSCSFFDRGGTDPVQLSQFSTPLELIFCNSDRPAGRHLYPCRSL